MTAVPGFLQEDLENGEDVATCPSCSLILRVIYDQVGAGRGLPGAVRPASLAPGLPSRVPARRPLKKARQQVLEVPGTYRVGLCELVGLLFVITVPSLSLFFYFPPPAVFGL